MRSSDQRWFSALTVAAVPLLPVSAEAQMIIRSFDDLLPSAGETVVVIEKPAQEAKSGALEISFESFEPLTRPVSLWPTRLARSRAFGESALRARQQTGPRKRGWIGRHQCYSALWSASAQVFLSAICRAMTASLMTSLLASMAWYWEGSGRGQERRSVQSSERRRSSACYRRSGISAVC